MEDNDYLIIALPIGATAEWDKSKAPTCSMKNGGRAKKCEITNSKEGKIVLIAQQHSVIRGTISNFINPISIQGISPLTATLYRPSRNRNRADMAVMSSSLSLQ